MLCTYEKTIWENRESGYCVSSFITRDSSVPENARNIKIRDGKIRFTATGYRLPASKAIDVRSEERRVGKEC